MPRKLWVTASLEVWPVGEGDPILTDKGFGMHDILAETYQSAEYDYGTDGLPKLEFIEGIGITNRMTVSYRSTRLTDFDYTNPTDWDEVQPDAKYRVRMFNNTPGVVATATAKSAFPENPQFCIELDALDVPTDWDNTALPAYIRFELGPNAEWAIHIDKLNGGAYLLKNGQAVKELGSIGHSRKNRDAVEIRIRCLRGQICVSFDDGQSYVRYGHPDNPATIHAGKLKIKSQGQAFGIGVHSLKPVTGIIRGSRRNTFKSRFASEIITGRYDNPSGTGVAFQDIHTAPNEARWQATLTPNRVSTFPFDFWATPSLYSVTVRYPFIRVVDPGALPTTPYDPYILNVKIQKDDTLSDSSATVTFHQKAYATFGNLDDWRDRKVRIKTGYKLDDGSPVIWTHSFTGYVQAINLAWDGFNSVTVSMTIENALIPFKKQQWSPLDVVPFGGMTPVAIGDYLLKSVGWMDEAGVDTSRRSWSGLNGTATVPLEWGYPEEPFELVRPREYKIETLARIFGYRGLDIAADDDGVIFDVLKNWVDQSDPLHFYPNSQVTNDPDRQIKKASAGIDFRNSATTIMVFGQTPAGETMMIMNVDDQAESNPASGRFAPFSVNVQEDISGVANPQTLMDRANTLALQYFPRDNRGDMIIRMDNQLNRRRQVIIHGCEGIGIPDGADYVARTISHDVQLGINRAETTMGIKLI